jgi:RNA polymerase subunit RPABC4/transcription elongation factor Spt4
MDSTPDECGYYLVCHKETTMPKWFQVNIVIRREDSKMIAQRHYTNVDDPFIEEDEFDDYLWSEKIKEPDME